MCSEVIFPLCLSSPTYLQVLSFSSSWRSLQYSSVCLQEHRQVVGSCTNRRLLLSEHGSQTLDRETDRGGMGWGEGGGKRRERQIITVCKCHPWARPPLGQPLHTLQLVLHSHSLTSGSACDSWVVLHAGNHWAGKHPSSKIPLAHTP